MEKKWPKIEDQIKDLKIIDDSLEEKGYLREEKKYRSKNSLQGYKCGQSHSMQHLYITELCVIY